MSIHFIDQGTPEWDYAWDQLATADINLGQADPIACEHPECGEIWQYMGTVYENVQGIPDRRGISFATGCTVP